MTELTRKDIRDFLRIVFVCVCWYVVSSSNGVLGKTILSRFPYPATLTMCQLTSIAVLSPPVLGLFNVRKMQPAPWSFYVKSLAPLALAKFLSSLLAHVSIWKVPVSYAHTVKASMPIFTVVITRILFGDRQSSRVYLSLVPIVAGVAVATVSELFFDLTGLISALLATGGFSLMNIFSKRALKETGMHHLRLLHVLGLIAAILFVPVWLVVDLPHISNDLSTEVSVLLLMDGVLHWLQNIMAFTLLKLVTPLTYAVANVTKRISVITVSLLLLKNPVTLTNMGGMLVAIMGVFLYNKAKYDDNLAQRTLPTQAPKQAPPLWQNHITYEPKVQVATPIHYLGNGDLKRNQ